MFYLFTDGSTACRFIIYKITYMYWDISNARVHDYYFRRAEIRSFLQSVTKTDMSDENDCSQQNSLTNS